MTDINGTDIWTSGLRLVVVSLTPRLLVLALKTGSIIMAKAFMPVFTVVSVFALPTGTSAQGNDPWTRGLVHEEAVRLEQAGRDHAGTNAHYPANIHASLASVAAQQQAFSGYGGAKAASASRHASTPSQLASYRWIHSEG